MPRMLRIAHLEMSLLLLAAIPLAAQTSRSDSLRLLVLIDGLAAGADVKIASRNRVTEGQFTTRTGDSVRVNGYDGRYSFSLSEIDGVWIKARSAGFDPLWGAMIGIAGGALAMALPAGLASINCGDNGQSNCVAAETLLLGGALGGGVLGALAGYWRGTANAHWEQRYPRLR
jgi:hypothetical protein